MKLRVMISLLVSLCSLQTLAAKLEIEDMAFGQVHRTLDGELYVCVPKMGGAELEDLYLMNGRNKTTTMMDGRVLTTKENIVLRCGKSPNIKLAATLYCETHHKGDLFATETPIPVTITRDQLNKKFPFQVSLQTAEGLAPLCAKMGLNFKAVSTVRLERETIEAQELK